MAGLNPHAPEFRSLSAPNCSDLTNKWFLVPDHVLLDNFTGVTVTARSPYHPYVFTWHQNTDIMLVGPAWLLIKQVSSLTSSPPFLLPPISSSVQEKARQEPAAVVERSEDGARREKNNNMGYSKREERKAWKRGKSMSLKHIKKADEQLKIKPLERGGGMTTVMIKNIPNQYTRELLMRELDKHCKEENEKSEEGCKDLVSAFDFLYLPIDFRSTSNKGYAFVNFTHPSAVWKFSISWDHRTWPDFGSRKICELTYAKLQGKQALKQHFEGSVFPCDKEEYLPVCFDPPRDGLTDNNVEHKLIVVGTVHREVSQL